jgi:glutamate dehydrogenase/leucine dehydrogenase
VTCSYFEDAQRLSNDYWNRDDVLQKLDARMTARHSSLCMNEPHANNCPFVRRRT